MDALQAKKRQEEEDQALAIICPKCIKRHPLKSFPLDRVEVCLLCDQEHPTKDCPSLLGLKAIYEEAGMNVELVFLYLKSIHGNLDAQVQY